jgi:hypothetical protein
VLLGLNLEADEFLPALGHRTDQNEHALGLILLPGLQADAFGPDLDIAASGQFAALPTGILVRQGRGRPGDDERRQVRGNPTQKGDLRFMMSPAATARRH